MEVIQRRFSLRPQYLSLSKSQASPASRHGEADSTSGEGWVSLGLQQASPKGVNPIIQKDRRSFLIPLRRLRKQDPLPVYWISTSQEPSEVGVRDEHLSPSVPWEVPLFHVERQNSPEKDFLPLALTHPIPSYPWEQ